MLLAITEEVRNWVTFHVLSRKPRSTPLQPQAYTSLGIEYTGCNYCQKQAFASHWSVLLRLSHQKQDLAFYITMPVTTGISFPAVLGQWKVAFTFLKVVFAVHKHTCPLPLPLISLGGWLQLEHFGNTAYYEHIRSSLSHFLNMDLKSHLPSLCGNLQSFAPAFFSQVCQPLPGFISLPFQTKFHGMFHPSFFLSLTSLIPLSPYPSATPVLQTANWYVLYTSAAPSPKLEILSPQLFLILVNSAGWLLISRSPLHPFPS